MKIVVLNGSPKGEVSVTMQYVAYIQKKFPQHEMKIIHIAQSIKKIENDTEVFDGIIEEIRASDGVLWAFPLYYLLVQSNYKRFIELINERHVEAAFKDKYTAVLSTSIHFYDHTAHNYMHGICDDLDMKYVDYFSANMDDLMKEDMRKRFLHFTSSFFETVENKKPTTKANKKLNAVSLVYTPEAVQKKIDIKGQKLVIVTDTLEDDTNLGKMITHLRQSFSTQPELINLNDLNIKGGCLGCLHCGFDNICVYDKSDDIRNVYENKLKNADIIVYAGKITDRFLSSKWKLFTDRRFFNTHRPFFKGKQFAYVISGPLSELPNLREVIQAYAEVDSANLVDIVTDEYSDSKKVDALLENLAEKLVFCAENKYVRPATFLGVGGMQLFRDAVWGHMRFVFQGDHKYYKQNGIYNFPQKEIGTRFINFFMIPLTKIKPIKKNIQSEMTKMMLLPYKKVLSNEKL